MYQKLILCALSLLYPVLTLQPVLAETVLEKVSRTGILRAGTSKDALPFAYANEQGQLVGYSVDMLRLIADQLEKKLGQEVELQLVAVEPQQRIPHLIKGELDIVCDASSFTWQRDQQIDFSVSYGITGTRLLVKRGSHLGEPESLAGKRIGALSSTTNELAIKGVQPQAQIILLPDRAAGYAALDRGQIDAFADDGILLEGWLQRRENPGDYQIVGYYSQEGIACMVPENNSQFLNNVNYALVQFMQGFLAEKKPYVSIFDRWFGPQGVIALSQDLQDLVRESMQLILDFKEEIPTTDLEEN
jgi:polar amino acid transport system substrate-binding protein